MKKLIRVEQIFTQEVILKDGTKTIITVVKSKDLPDNEIWLLYGKEKSYELGEEK